MENDENSQPANEVSVGGQLQRAREKAGLSIKEVADVQHLRCGVIQAIENGEYEKIDTELFLKGYVRAYSKQVGLDPDKVIADLEVELEPLRQKRVQEYEANPLVSIERRRRQKRRLGKLFLLLITIILIAFLVFTFGLGGYAGVSTQSSIASEATEQADAVSASDDVSGNGASDDSFSPEDDRSAEDLPEALGEEPEANISEPAEEVIAESESFTPVVVESIEPALVESIEPLATTDTGILQITFIDDCWVQVRDGTGDKLVNSLQRKGDRIDVSGEIPLHVVIGAVDAVGSIRFQGEVIDMHNYSVVNNRSEFSLTI